MTLLTSMDVEKRQDRSLKWDGQQNDPPRYQKGESIVVVQLVAKRMVVEAQEFEIV